MFNPFVINGIIPDKYFCDRVTETQKLTSCIRNQTNLLLTSPRRMGKTQLIYHTYGQKPIADDFYTFYVDILPSTSLREFTLLLGKEIYRVLVPSGAKAVNLFLSTLRSLYGNFGFDHLNGLPSFDIKLGDIPAPELTLSEIFTYLQNADKPCVCTIDEFQQIGSYPEKSVEALLRSHVQKTSNCVFIFAGSDRHTLENMFNSPAKPFYNSVDHMYLGSIRKEEYIRFILEKFKESGREIAISACHHVYDLFEGHTYYIHRILHNVYANADACKVIEIEDIDIAVTNILEDKEHSFHTQMSYLNYTQKETLIAIAKEKDAHEVTSVTFVKKHSLQSPSSVQNAIRNLLKMQVITFRQEAKKKIYMVSDRFLQMWIKNKY